ncbi:MAG: T9SS type A sorting domain-containing protein, partial [Bacteroidales bacterium]|nr:T9SS type A sorting domain-containing protein [Bacteroidales bacterium]
PNDTTQAITLAEQYTYLMPNPAKDAVTVASSFRVKTVELYASDGKLLQRKEVNAVGTTLSLEGLPAGIYFVRVYTAAGATTKRLLIE